MSFSPLIDLKPTTIKKAFLLNAILTAIITGFTIELRRILDENEYSKYLSDRPHKLLITIIISVLIGLIAYISCRFVFGLGDGMLSLKNPPRYFFY